MRVVVRVTARAGATHVGGRYGTDDPPVLAVRVTAPAIAGKANEAVVAALAAALKVPARNVRVVSGGSSRLKHIEISADVTSRIRELLEAR